MSENQDPRAERVARYKEERRRQLAAQFSNLESSPARTKNKDASGSTSGSEGPRPTRASRLRLAALSQDNVSIPQQGIKLEKSPKSPSPQSVSDLRAPGSRRADRDKSNKRKSNLNRSTTSEEVPPADFGEDVKNRRRRRRFFPPEVLDQSIRTNTVEEQDRDANITAPVLSHSPSSPITASSPTIRLTPKKSELSVHMENARRGVTPAFSELGKYKPFAKRAFTSSPKSSPSRNVETSLKVVSRDSKTSAPDEDKTRAIASRMEELSNLTKQTLARVERLASRNKETSSKPSSRNSPLRVEHKVTSKGSRKSPSIERLLPSSILKRKTEESAAVHVEPVVFVPTAAPGPVSILKRKVSQDDHNRSDGAHTSNNTPPVTFSPSVVEPSTSRRKQGILKKRRSLDESTVLRHRSCSPDVANKSDSRSILKSQRRSSLEELRRTQSPETHLHSILKRKTSRNEEDDHSLNSPQGILKRRSGASSAGSTSSTPHVSITTAVILAAARGAEMVLDPENEHVKPILKKKSFSEDHSYHSDMSCDTPKPILKKKSSTETDESDDKPKPILKLPKLSLERETLDTGQESSRSLKLSESECEYRPILKQGTSREERPRLSFCGESSSLAPEVRLRSSRRSNTICTDFNVASTSGNPKEEDRQLRKPRPLSVSELVMTFEKTCSTTVSPKKTSLKRNSDRYKTQPVTSGELEASLNLVHISNPLNDTHQVNHCNLSTSSRSLDGHSLLDFTSSLDHDSNLNSFLSSSLHNTASPESLACGKMSSDSAFQSLGDGLELEQEDESESSTKDIIPKSKGKLEPSKLELQMKAIAEEAKKMRLGKGNAGIERYRSKKSASGERASSRSSTQPVTFEEVQEASRMNKGADDTGGEVDGDTDDPSNLSLSERIRMFDRKSTTVAESPSPRTPSRWKGRARYSTEIVDAKDVAAARSYFLHPQQSPFALDGLDADKTPPESRSILKTPENSASPRPPLSPTITSRSALKKRLVSPNRNPPIINVGSVSPDRDDEGISCNDSASDSDYSAKEEAGCSSGKSAGGRYARGNGDSTSEGESSGGREVRSIFKNENQLRLKQTLENVLSKSRSQGMLGNVQPCPAGGGYHPKKTVTVRRSQTQNEMPRSIADLRAKLQERGESDWKKRVPLSNNATDELKLLKEKNRYNNELSEKTLLDSKKDELDASSKQWKARVEKSDAEKFSVAGKMGEKIRDAVPTINIPACDDNRKRTPQAKRFKLRDGADSTPTSPEKNSIFDLTRSKSVPYSPMNYEKSDTNIESKSTARTVSVFRPDDVTFDTFFKTVEQSNNNSQRVELSLDDFDAVERQSLLVIKKNVQVPKRRGATKNPIKALASRTDITNEYTEVITGVAEREKKRLNIEKLAQNSNKALEALAGLASNEDFKSVALKKSSVLSIIYPWKELMLLQVKGRRHVQTRLVQPVASSINEGDSFILITPKALYNYNGKYSNIIEQSRAADVVNHIQKTGDMGCKVDKVITIGSDVSSSHVEEFWRIMGCKDPPETVDAGHPDEDETFESNILHTNMIYTLEDDELIPHEKYWGAIPKIEMLNETAIHVFDFGSEMYVWSGKTAPIAKKKLAMKLAKDIWDDGYNYSDCNICPLNAASILGAREQLSLPKQDNKRPDWALFAKITQHRETVLFREKFLDWPDFSRVIRVKSNDSIKEINPSYDIKPCSVDEMLQEPDKNPDLVIDNTHLGRGDRYYEEDTRRHFEYETLEIKGWRILENTHDELKHTSIGQFYDGDSYIYSWSFRQTVRGRELNGNPSKRAPVGRDRCIFFCWQGTNSSINEKGTAAFLTVELDKQNAPQVRIVQGSEPAAFLNLFGGSMVIYKGKRDEVERSEKPRLFIVRGEVGNEVYLIEVPLITSSLRSRSSFVLVDIETEQITLWHGSKSSKHKRKITKQTVQKLLKNKPAEMYLDDYEEDLDIVEMDEGEETDDFLNVLGGDRESYHSLLESDLNYDFTMRMYSLSSITGVFTASEVLCLHRSEYMTPYPFVQNELYSASQPGLFLVDNDHELWLWQGWWPETEDETEDLSDQTGSGAMRFQAERRAAMQTAVNYWKKKHGEEVPVKAFLVWAGMEPLQFKCLFPSWEDRYDVKELNAKEGKIEGDVIPLEQELALLSRTTYPLAELLQRPLPDGVDPTHIEKYLSPEDFQVLLSMSKEEFDKLPSWKQTALKKEKGLF